MSIPAIRYEGLISKWISELRVSGVISNYFSSMVNNLAPEVCPAISATEGGEANSAMTAQQALPLMILVLLVFFIAGASAAMDRCYRKAKQDPKMKDYLSAISIAKAREYPSAKPDLESSTTTAEVDLPAQLSSEVTISVPNNQELVME
eukprot:scaffold336903_cov52-Prasinocladus_malaysianus.AAC.1